MNKDYEKEILRLFEGDVNEDAIREYLTVQADESWVKLALEMAPKPQTSNPSEAMAAARKIIADLEAEQASQLAREREALVNVMNFETLLEIVKRLGFHDQAIWPDSEEKCSDPVAGPVVRRFWEIQYYRPHDEFEKFFESANSKERLIEADARGRLPRPSPYCSLEEALRYAADAPRGEVSLPTLRRAFMDLLKVSPLQTMSEKFLMYLAGCDLRFAADRVKHLPEDEVQNKLSKLIRKKNNPEMKAFSDNIDAQIFRENFIPGAKAPKSVKRNAELAFKTYWAIDCPVIDQSKLAWLTVEFYPFWQKHRKAYKNPAKYKSQTAVNSGKLGSISKMRPKWEDRTDNFIRFCEDRQVPRKGTDEWDDFFKKFSETQPEQRRTQKEIAAFMRTLYDFANRLTSGEPIAGGMKTATLAEEMETLIRMLNSEGIEAVDLESIGPCFIKLIENL